MDHRSASPIIAVVGPTATGKSDLALRLATELGPSEIVNADAMQLYRGLDIGTAKLSKTERQGIEHHQIDVLEPAEVASVAAYQRAAREDLTGIRGRGGRPLVVGGSGLYVRALLDRLEFPGTDAQVRAALESRAAAEGVPALFAELQASDPPAAAAIGARNTRRIVRALEVIAVTGRPFSAFLPEAEYLLPTLVIGLDAPRDWLDARIEQRVDRMFADGLVAEVRSLASPDQGGTGSGLGVTAARALGYAEVLEMLRGSAGEAETRDLIKANTRRLARKQMGWFGRDPRIHWLDATAPDLVAQASSLVAAFDNGELETPTSRIEPRSEPTRRALGSV